MTLYTDVAGSHVQTEIPIIEDNGPGLFDCKIRSFLMRERWGKGSRSH